MSVQSSTRTRRIRAVMGRRMACQGVSWACRSQFGCCIDLPGRRGLARATRRRGSARAASGKTMPVYDIQSGGQSSQVSLTAASRAEVRERLATIGRALRSVRQGALDDVYGMEARRAAHKLAGSLDILGMTRAGELAGELESLLQNGTVQGSGARAAFADLRSEVERGLLAKPTVPAEPAVPATPSTEAIARILLAEDDDIMARMIEAAL